LTYARIFDLFSEEYEGVGKKSETHSPFTHEITKKSNIAHYLTSTDEVIEKWIRLIEKSRYDIELQPPFRKSHLIFEDI